MKFYAIRQKSTGLFMPAGRSRGFTHDEPTARVPPRLFMMKQHAQSALNCWLMGDWHNAESFDQYGEVHDVYPEPGNNRPERKREDTAVVEVVLSFRT